MWKSSSPKDRNRGAKPLGCPSGPTEGVRVRLFGTDGWTVTVTTSLTLHQAAQRTAPHCGKLPAAEMALLGRVILEYRTTCQEKEEELRHVGNLKPIQSELWRCTAVSCPAGWPAWAVSPSIKTIISLSPGQETKSRHLKAANFAPEQP